MKRKTEHPDQNDELFQGDRDRVYSDLRLYRVEWNGQVSHLVAAHSYAEAVRQMKYVKPGGTFKVWSQIGPANDYNLKGWRKQVLNPNSKAVLEAP